MKPFLLVLQLILLVLGASAQMNIDKAINLSGSGSNAKISGIKEVNQAGDAVSAGVLQAGGLLFATATGTDNYVVSLTPAPAAYTAGMVINFRATNANTGASTLNVNGLGAVSLEKVSSALVAGDIAAGQMVTVLYDGSSFQLTSRGNLSPADIPSLDASKITTGTIGVARGGTGTSTAFTAGSVIFAGTSGVYAQDNAQLFWNNTSNRLGIGTATPTQSLHVTGTSRFDDDMFIGGDAATNKPIRIIRYVNRGNDANFSTGVSATTHNCVVTGWSTLYDIQEDNANVNMIWTYVSGGVWWVRMSLASHNNDESPDIDVVCFRTEISNWEGGANTLNDPD